MVSDRKTLEVRFNDAIRRLVLWMAGVFALACLLGFAVRSFSWR